jgi:anti-sigma B factor antagonist
MRMSVDEKDGVTIVRIGESKLTYPILSSFFSEIQGLVAKGTRKLLIDFAAVSYIDSASIGCVMDIHRLLGEQGGALKLVSPQPRVETLLSMTGVHKIVDIHRDEAEALAGLRQ